MAILLAEHIQLSTLGAFRESEIFSARLSEGSKSTGVPNDESPNSQAAATVALDFEVLLWPNVLQSGPRFARYRMNLLSTTVILLITFRTLGIVSGVL